MKRVTTMLFAILVPLLAGCADQLSGDVYTREEARQPMQVSYGTVTAVRPVALEGERDVLGHGSGAIIGGIAGHTVGSGSGQDIATAVGAVAGGVVGGMTQERVTRAQGAEIIIQPDHGAPVAVIQEVQDLREFVPGQRVRLISGSGNTRVAPLTRVREDIPR